MSNVQNNICVYISRYLLYKYLFSNKCIKGKSHLRISTNKSLYAPFGSLSSNGLMAEVPNNRVPNASTCIFTKVKHAFNLTAQSVGELAEPHRIAVLISLYVEYKTGKESVFVRLEKYFTL